MWSVSLPDTLDSLIQFILESTWERRMKGPPLTPPVILCENLGYRVWVFHRWESGVLKEGALCMSA